MKQYISSTVFVNCVHRHLLSLPLFMCVLFNDALSRSDRPSSNDRMIIG